MNKGYTKKYLARKYRNEGKSYSEILELVKVAKSTLSLWLRDIPLTTSQKAELAGRNKSRYLGSQKRKQERIDKTKIIIKEATASVPAKINDPLFYIGVMLYWAEGTKRGNDMINFSNSDPNMIKLMMRWFRQTCEVPNDKIKIQIHIHDLMDEEKIISYWQAITGIPKKNFHKLIIKKTTLKHRKNELYRGTCCIRIYDVTLFRRIIGWRIGILKNFDIKEIYQVPQ
jgi:hypothetical protein